MGLELLSILEDEALQENARNTGGYARELVEKLKGKHVCIGDVRGQGLLFGVEFVRHPATREPAAEVADHVMQWMREHRQVHEALSY